jgi:hypothetical protein
LSATCDDGLARDSLRDKLYSSRVNLFEVGFGKVGSPEALGVSQAGFLLSAPKFAEGDGARIFVHVHCEWQLHRLEILY